MPPKRKAATKSIIIDSLESPNHEILLPMKGWYKVNRQFNLIIINRYFQQISKAVPFSTFTNASPFHKLSNLIPSGVTLLNNYGKIYKSQAVKQNEEEESVPKVDNEAPGKKQRKPKVVKEADKQNEEEAANKIDSEVPEKRQRRAKAPKEEIKQNGEELDVKVNSEVPGKRQRRAKTPQEEIKENDEEESDVKIGRRQRRGKAQQEEIKQNGEEASAVNVESEVPEKRQRRAQKKTEKAADEEKETAPELEVPEKKGRKGKEPKEEKEIKPKETKKQDKKSEKEEAKPKKGKASKVEKPAKATKKTEPKAPLQNVTETDWESIDFGCNKKNAKGEDFNLKITSWNVDGLRACIKKHGMNLLEYDKPDILCLQETKCSEDKMPEEITDIEGYKDYWFSSQKDGYAGVGVYSKTEPINVMYGIGEPEHDDEGRCITLEYDNFYLVNVYVPNAGRGLVTLPKRLEWNQSFKGYIKKLDKKKPVIVCGDMNVAHSEIDLTNPKTNKKNAGFTQEERDGMTDFLEDGYVDSFRELYPDERDVFTFWSYMSKARSKNIGWRLDYFIVSNRIMENICDNVVRNEVYGSDHCPITLFINI